MYVYMSTKRKGILDFMIIIIAHPPVNRTGELFHHRVTDSPECYAEEDSQTGLCGRSCIVRDTDRRVSGVVMQVGKRQRRKRPKWHAMLGLEFLPQNRLFEIPSMTKLHLLRIERLLLRRLFLLVLFLHLGELHRMFVD